MDDIVKMIREYMEANCITYEEVAQAIHMTRQNLWMRLNKRKSPGFGLIRDLLFSLGFDFVIDPIAGWPRPVGYLHLDKLIQAPELEKVDFGVVKALVRACGYDLQVRPPKNFQRPSG